MMTDARLAEIRERWKVASSHAGDDVRDLLTALDAHREAVRVAAEECVTWRTHTEENYYTNALRAARKSDANPILAAAIKEQSR